MLVTRNIGKDIERNIGKDWQFDIRCHEVKTFHATLHCIYEMQ